MASNKNNDLGNLGARNCALNNNKLRTGLTNPKEAMMTEDELEAEIRALLARANINQLAAALILRAIAEEQSDEFYEAGS